MTVPETTRDRGGLLPLALTAAAIVVLHLLGNGTLSPPPVRSLRAVDEWIRERDAVTAAFALLRVVALVVAYHLVITTVLALVGRTLGQRSLVAFAERWTLPPFRGAVRRAVGLGLSATFALSSPFPPADASPVPASSQEVSGRDTVRAPLDLVVAERIGDHDANGTATLRIVESDGTATLRVEGVDVPNGRPSAPKPPTDAKPANQMIHVIVAPGDHLWALAERRMSDHLGRAATDAEIDPYWRAVMAANPQVIVPDLIYPGDTVHLPPVG